MMGGMNDGREWRDRREGGNKEIREWRDRIIGGRGGRE